MRDVGALEAALHRPQTGYYWSIIEEAAALMESLVQNHPFIDGNKRVAFAVVDATMMGPMNAGEFDLVHLSRWLEGIVVPSKPAGGRER